MKMVICHYVIPSDSSILLSRQIFQLSRISRRFSDTDLTIQKEGRSIPGASLIGLISLMIQGGDTLTITASGKQEMKAVA